ncbi:hypothetical protein NH26_07000 [Flammeovirga pacifica]|uniref:Uncharacterized protein n=2 Tax=Flammeovirga pacifica TaxID=915059 RepID=A0A1S1YYM4_FLAPC|nr:hypothetical protein NH26_07000 [Flammeovirga pacifica]
MNPDQSPVESKVHTMFSAINFTKNGILDISKSENGSVVVHLELTTPATETYSIKIFNGKIDSETELESVFDLTSIETGNTTSITDVTGSYSFDELTTGDFHVRVLNSNNGDVVSITDIGVNTFNTTEAEQYSIQKEGREVGMCALVPRLNGPMMVGVSFYEKEFDQGFDLAIYTGTALAGNNQNVLIELNDVMQRTSTATSYTNISEDYPTPISIEDGYLRVVRVPLIQGEEYYSKTDIGGNALSGNSMSYDFDKPNYEENLGGWVKLEERLNGHVLFSYQVTTDQKPSLTYAVALNDDDYIQHGANVASLGQYKAESGDIFYADVSELKDGSPITYNDIIGGTYSVRMNQSADTDYNGPNYVMVSDIGQAALSEISYEADITFTDVDYLSENMKIVIHKRLNGLTYIEIDGSDYTDDQTDHDLKLYTGTDHEAIVAREVVRIATIDQSYEGYLEKSPYLDADGAEITFDEIMERAGHYRLLDDNGDEIGYAVLPN